MYVAEKECITSQFNYPIIWEIVVYEYVNLSTKINAKRYFKILIKSAKRQIHLQLHPDTQKCVKNLP